MNKETTKMIPGDELHLTMLMAPYSLNLVTGQDRQHLLAFGRAAFEAGKADLPAQCLHQIAEPAAISEGEAFQALSELTNALRERHYGRMPSEVQAAYDKAWTIVFAGEKRAPVTQQAPAHPDDAAVDALAALMKAKLAEKRAKGYGGWNNKSLCPQQRLSDMLRAHVDKGDPVDVANFCAMLSARGEGIAAAPQAVQAAVPLPMVELFGVKDGQETRLGAVPMPPTMRAREMLHDVGFTGLDDDDGDGAYAMGVCEQLIEYCKAYYEAPAHPAEGVPAQAAATQPAAQGMEAIRALIAQHSKELEHNHYAYFELAYTRRTGWMVWITDKPAFRESVLVNPDRKVLASGQGDTPEAACAAALAAQAKQGSA